MFELIWGLFNGVLLIYFFIICIRLLKIFKEKMGILATLIFVLLLFSFFSKSNNNNLADIDFENTKQPKKNYVENSFFQQVILEDNLSSKISLSILVNEKDNELNILKANCSRVGFISGTNWVVKYVDVKKQLDENYCNYDVSGIMEWKILGITLYDELKNFNGETILKRE
jgi:hypothetical protein